MLSIHIATSYYVVKTTDLCEIIKGEEVERNEDLC